MPLKLWHYNRFQSTLPLRGATPKRIHYYLLHHISIHAPLTGSDLVALFRLLCGLYFNPRSPYGERLEWIGISTAGT